MKIVIEKLRNHRGELVDLKFVDEPNSIFEAARVGVDPKKYAYVQVIDGRPIQGFTDAEMMVIEG